MVNGQCMVTSSYSACLVQCTLYFSCFEKSCPKKTLRMSMTQAKELCMHSVSNLPVVGQSIQGF